MQNKKKHIDITQLNTKQNKEKKWNKLFKVQLKL